MCGICGIAHADPARPVDAALLRRMRDVLRHRGPDGEGIHCGGGVGLAHRRLSIIDVAGGRQPLGNEDGTVWTTFNGEIFNYQDLRRQLLAAGHVFRTVSDTEVLVHGYEQWGDDLPLRAPVGTPLLRDGIGLDPLGGTMLLAEVQRRFGVDVAGEDLNLDSLATLRSLAEYVAARVMPG